MSFFTKDHSRYPYTFAYDWMRQAGVAGSRADAAEWAVRAAKAVGVDVKEFIERAADEYIEYWKKHEEAEALAREKLGYYANIQPPSDEPETP